MCGIIGVLSRPNGVPAQPFAALLDTLSHRGPDAAGVFCDRVGNEVVQLGHRRLSIIDLSAEANQPFEKDGLVIVFNGEIYNYRELRAVLGGFGVQFRTLSDTEVILEAWRLWGPEALRRLRGMFAFAIYCRASGRLVLARDPFGIKPLYILRHGGIFAFASELKALVPLLGTDAEIDDRGVVASLIYGWVPEEFSVLRGVAKLPCGHWLVREPGGAVVERAYWDPVNDLLNQDARGLELDELRSVLHGSVSAHMVADVPVAAFLSGGLDSSLISVIARRQAGGLDAFTIAFRDEDSRFEAMPDDRAFARQVARTYDIRLHEILIEPDLATMLPKIVGFLDEPIGDAAAINAYLICQAARDRGIKVLLSGMGADEIFSGYRRHYACALAARYRRVPEVIRSRIIEPAVERLPAAGRTRGYRIFRWAKRFVKFAGLNEEQAFRRSYTFLDRAELADALNRDLSPHIDEVLERHAEIYAQGADADPVTRMCHADIRMFLPGLNLTYTDRASMAASTEVRVPFVDVEVMRAAFRLRGSEKLRGRETKYLLKKAAEAWLPNTIIYRPKGLFSAPLRAWVRNDLRGLIEEVLPNGELVNRGYLRAGHIRRLIDADRAGREDNSKEIWHVLTLDYWLRAHRASSDVAHAEAMRRVPPPAPMVAGAVA